MANTYGQKGGDSPTAGKRAETLRSPTTGLTKRVFKGQRWLVIAQQNEAAPCDLLAFESQERAKRCSDGCYRLGYDVHYVEQAEVVSA
jgi:hypothetical protein